MVEILVSNLPSGFFGGIAGSSSVRFSPDSQILAIGEHGGKTVQLFSRSGAKWNSIPVVLTETTASGFFGAGLSFSADGSILAISENTGTSNGILGAGNVYLYTKSGATWTLTNTVSALVPTANNFFGFSVFFSPLGSELAIFEFYGDTTAATDAGVVTIIDISQLP